ncbi:hypothetical protein ACWD25_27550 [Streptomyces sp. NPDC002920]
MSTVLMRHPTLPPEQEIEVDEQAVPHYANAGWLHVPAEELDARAAAAAKAAAEQAAAAEGEQLLPLDPPYDATDELAEARRREALEETQAEAAELPAADDESAAPKRRRRSAAADSE